MTTLSTLGQSQFLIRQFSSLQGQIQEIQTQVATNQKTQRYGDLGSQTSLDINLHNQATQVDDYTKTISQLQVRAGLVDTSLSIIHDTTVNVQNLSFATPQTSAGRINLVAQAQAAIDQINNRLQTQVDGRNLFSGTETQSQTMVPQSTLLPIVKAAVTTALNANALLTPPLPVATVVQSAVAAVFDPVAPFPVPVAPMTTNFYSGGPPTTPTQIASGLAIDTSITGGDPAFRTMLQGLYTIAAMPQPVAAPATAPNIDETDFDAIAAGSGSVISQGLTSLQTLTEKNGNNEAVLTQESTQHAATLTVLQTQIDNIENVDLAAASTKLTQLQTQLDASYRITASLSGLSLVDFLK
jgi:flagellar hook-associated protein 3 FlgL